MFSSVSRPRVIASVVGLVAAALLTACAGTFAFRVQSSSPGEIGSVFVLFGKEADFIGKERSAEIVKLLQPSKLANYVGHTEYELDGGEATAAWKQLSERLPSEIVLTVEDDPPALAFALGRGLLELHPDLGIAVVVRTSSNDYLIKTWEHSVVAEAEGTLFIDVTGAGVTGTLQ